MVKPGDFRRRRRVWRTGESEVIGDWWKRLAISNQWVSNRVLCFVFFVSLCCNSSFAKRGDWVNAGRPESREETRDRCG
jgi:hypothetical protein